MVLTSAAQAESRRHLDGMAEAAGLAAAALAALAAVARLRDGTLELVRLSALDA